jgi:hypothetical protein
MTRPVGLTLGCALVATVAPAQFVYNTEIKGDTATVTFNSPRVFAQGGITGAPFTADRVSEHTQTLADGTHISQPQNVEHISRDSQGRTRDDRPIFRAMGIVLGAHPPEDFRLTEISDPMAGLAYVLDDQNKVAHRITMTPRQAGPPRISVGAGAGSVPGGAEGVGAGGALPRVRADSPTQPQHTMEKLESKNIEGVIAEGTRGTTTWPVGSQGNDRPIVQTNETWRSGELKETVLSRNVDPRNGESVTKLININRAEPDPALFQPPAGYTIVDEKESFTITLKRQ